VNATHLEASHAWTRSSLRGAAPNASGLSGGDRTLDRLRRPFDPRLDDRALEIELEGVRIGIIHDAGRRVGRTERLRASFPDADCIIFGHSHAAEHRHAEDLQIFNPGSPTERRRAPWRSMGIAELERGKGPPSAPSALTLQPERISCAHGQALSPSFARSRRSSVRGWGPHRL
jgi:hypothetical protein